MTRTTASIALFALLTLAGAAAPPSSVGQDPARLYGRVTTHDGSVFEGFLRWDTNEAGLYDIFHSTKRVPERYRDQAERLGADRERRRPFEFLGIRFSLPGDGSYYTSSASSGIRAGHVSTVEPLTRGRVRLLLKSGQELELAGGSDLGSSVDILLMDRLGTRIELEWRDIRLVDFLPAPTGWSAPWGDRLYGTLTTTRGERFTGYVAWDMDEVFAADTLDGDTEDDRDVELPFGRIAAIARESSRESRVELRDGGRLYLHGTNDVNSGNRDILIADPALGEVRVAWNAFDRLDFEPPPTTGARDFDGGARLTGTVRARDGRSYTGAIRWDNDEEYTWEILDGELRSGVDLDIEFGLIASIERAGSDAARVTLRDGRSFTLGGSNDVDAGNKGIYIDTPDQGTVLVEWDRFERVDFAS